MIRRVAVAAFALCVAAGTWLDPARGSAVKSGAVLIADLHVHPYPGDGSLPVRELQREAGRRGLDVVAITPHNNRVALGMSRLVGLDPEGPIVLPGQEVTAPGFHIVALGTARLVDWRLPAADAISEIHAQGGIAIAAHPVDASWRVPGDEALRALDGAEVAQPGWRRRNPARDEFDKFFRRVQAVNPGIAPIGSSDFHMNAPLALCRTYLLTSDHSVAGVLGAIRDGRTVAQDGRGRLIGAAADVAAVEAHLAASPPPPGVPMRDRLLALGALLALAALTIRDRQG